VRRAEAERRASGGKHEPPTGRSFYISLATSTLRAIILAAAVILGVVGLTKAFPSGTSPVTPTGGAPAGSPSASSSPSTPVSPTPSATPRAPSEVVVQVLNGSGVTGLAASKTNKIKKAGYNTKEPGDWPSHINSTVVYYKAGFRIDAEFIQARFFPEATVKPVAQAATANADVTIVLGTNEASPSPSG
jgi:hypothetical protein